ncbi:MAG: DUF4037 domain-containing protein [Chloroflexi bacterium]|nr:DUF4037 domain-containing protein [Chloroflexota bacterium]
MDFIPGIQLNELFYHEILKPLLAQNFPTLTYSAALIGSGSDVLGFDTAQSMDHNWGPRVKLFLTPADYVEKKDAIDQCLRQNLPHTFRGIPVGFSEPDKNDGGTQVLKKSESGLVNHLIGIGTLHKFLQGSLGIDPNAPLTLIDWLTFPEHALLELVSGKVFHDGLNELELMRAKFAYYPRDVWLYRMAAQWQRISQEEPFVGRTGDVGDDLGSRIIAARLVRDVMRLAFLIEKRYAPYSKWLGTAFARSNCASRLTPILQSVLNASDWHEREKYLCDAYIIVAEMHNALGITSRVEPTSTNFFNRPYHVIFAARFAQALIAAIEDAQAQLKKLAPIGGVDQFSDSTDLIDTTPLTRRAQIFYQTEQPS